MEQLPREIHYAHIILEKLCRERQVLAHLDPRLQFHPGADLMQEAVALPPLINGRYGLIWTLTENNRFPIAHCGFDIKPGELIITNTPQGVTREKLAGYSLPLQKDIFTELRKGEFREELINGVIVMGKTLKNLGIKKITGVAAINHDKVDRNGGPLPLSTALKSMDTLFERKGFQKDEDGDYFLPLK